MFYKDHIGCAKEKGLEESKTTDNEEGSRETDADPDREMTVSWARAAAESVERRG